MSDDEIKRVAAGLRKEFQDDLKRLEQMEEDARLAAASKAREEAERAAASAARADEKLSFLLEQQAKEEEERRERRKWWARYVVVPLVTVLFPSGIYGVYRAQTKPTPTSPEDVKQTVEQRMKEVEHRQWIYGQRMIRLGDLHYEQLQVIVDSHDDLDKKLEAVMERLRVKDEGEDEEPHTIKEAKEAVDAYQKRKKAWQKDKFLKKGDPFSDIPDPLPLEPQRVDPPADED